MPSGEILIVNRRNNTLLRISAMVLLCFGLFACKQHHANGNDPDNGKQKQALLECIRSKDLSQHTSDSLRRSLNTEKIVFRLDTLFRNKVKSGFNGNVLVAQYGVILYEKCFGMENYGTQDTLCTNSKFQLASISKQFTAVAILKLMEEGKISLSNTVDQFFEGFPYANITIQSLLCHRSGLPEYMHVFSYKMKPYTITDNNEVISWFIKDKPAMAFKVNTHFTYCNSNYLILAAIVEKVTGRDFADYMEQEIFRPLGMDHTFVLTTKDARINEHRTFGYTPKWETYPLDFFDGVVGDKGVYTTLEDMYTWSKMLRSDCLLSKTTLEEAFKPRSFEKEGIKNYGYGFRMLNYKNADTKLIYHNGWWKGYNTCFYFSPKFDFVVIVFGNKYCRGTYQVQGILDILQGNKAGLVLGEEGAD